MSQPEPADVLAMDLAAAALRAGEVAGRPPLGLRAVEPGLAGRWYLCAFDGPMFLCLTGGLEVEADRRRVREVAVAGLVCEVADELVDADRLAELAAAAEHAAGHGGVVGEAAPHLARVAGAARLLADWRAAPERALASLVELESGTVAHDRLRGAYAGFLSATEWLAEVQERLPPDAVDALRAVEQAAIAAGVAEGLAGRLGALIPGLDEQADEILEAHIWPLVP